MKEIKKAIETVDVEELGEAYGYIGIRVQEESFGLSVGDTVEHNSKVWVDGDETDDELDGICALNYNMLDKIGDKNGEYFGACILVLGSDNTEYGEDYGEIIMQDAQVLAIINL